MKRSLIKRMICLVLSLCIILGSAAVAENTTTHSAAYAPLYYETKDSDEVRAMQIRLKELGYFDGNATGGYYKETSYAVKAFQQANGLPVNRKVASSEMLALLFSADAPTAGGQPIQTATPAPTATPQPSAQLKYGMKDNDDVKQMQRRLAELGYFKNTITGNYFDETQKAIEAFQRAMGMKVDGRSVDKAFLERLYSESVPGNGATAVVTPLPTETPRPTPSPATGEYTPLYYGTTNSTAVKQMQLRLKELKYLSAGATGGYWDSTKKAIEAFQEAVGLKVNGKCADSETLKKLFSADAPIKGGTVNTTPTYTELHFGQSSSKDVRAMQDRLRELGYFHDVSTGGYYRMTAQAVSDFQAAAGLPINPNTASVEMLKLLFSADAPAFGTSTPVPTATATPEATATPVPTATATPEVTATPVPTATATPEATATPAPTATATPEATATPVPTATATPEATATPAPTEIPEQEVLYAQLHYGMTGSDAVRRLQARLGELGYLSSSPTGGYWSSTAKAVRDFLKDHGMEGDGTIATNAMQQLLFAEQEAEPTPSPAPEATPTPTPEVTYEKLKYGMTKNAAVKAMQTRLRALGFFDESSTGNYYSITAAAVEAFQKAAGLPVDGDIASPEMQALLFSADAPSLKPQEPPIEEETPTAPELSTDYKPLSYATRDSEEVRAMQRKLKERGFFSGLITGGYWEETKAAVAAFQKYAKLPVNGKEASAEMLGYLFYEGDLDALIANGGVPPVGSVKPEYDADKYKDAQTNITLYLGNSGKQVDLLIMRLMELGYLEGVAPTSYNSNVMSAVKWFQNTNLLDADGIAGSRTLSKLYSKNALSADESMKDNITSSDPVEVEGTPIKVTIGEVKNIDWFSDAGDAYYDRRNGAFRDDATAIITDVATGISFRVRRSGGYNHADAEPLTAFDTWQMYKIYGKEWSWSRHAVYVTLENGVTLAGSMNGMPHGSGDITNNNFDGHFCIHFLNSRTHGSDKVDPDHQAAVAKAARK